MGGRRPGPPRPVVLALALAAASGCVTPPATTTYACRGGDSIVVGFGPRFAELHLPPDRVVRLSPEPAASGARYGDGRYILLTKGAEASLWHGRREVGKNCRTREEAALPDSLLTPRRAYAVAESLDALLAGRPGEARTLESDHRGWRPRRLEFWADSGQPVRLRVTEPGPAATPPAATSYYFVDGRLEVVRGPSTQYVFRDTTLIFWTTDSLQPLSDLPLRDMVSRQNFVLGEVRQYLAMFDAEPR